MCLVLMLRKKKFLALVLKGLQASVPTSVFRAVVLTEWGVWAKGDLIISGDILVFATGESVLSAPSRQGGLRCY